MKVLGAIVLLIVIIILVFGVDVFTCPVCRGVWPRRAICETCGGDGKVTLFRWALIKFGPPLLDFIESAGLKTPFRPSTKAKTFMEKLREMEKERPESPT